MDPKIMQQCRTAGGRIVDDKCVFGKVNSNKLNLERHVGGVDLKQAALWTFIGTIGFAALMGVLALLGQWGETQLKILATTGIIGLFGLLMIANFALFARRSKWLLYLFSITFTSGALISTLELWDINPLDFGKAWGTIGLVFGFGLIAIANNAVRGKHQWLTYAGWAVSGGAFLTIMNLLWEWKLFYCVKDAYTSCSISDGYTKFLLDLVVMAVLAGHMSLMLLINPTKPAVKNMQWATIGLATLTALIVMSIIHMRPTDMESTLRILGIVGILNVAATIITPVLNRTK